MDQPEDDYYLYEARQWLQENLAEGVTCPCCGQLAKIYRRTLTSVPARAMIRLYQVADGDEYLYLPKILDSRTAFQGGYTSLGHLWGLMEQEPGERDDGSNRVGWWRLTHTGHMFVRNRMRVPKYALVYNGKVREFDDTFEISIVDALGHGFNYQELMEGGWDE